MGIIEREFGGVAEIRKWQRNTNASLLNQAKNLSADQKKHANRYERFLRRELIIRGIKHKFQYPLVIYPKFFCLDFYFEAARLCVELDGQQHYTRKGLIQDEIRTKCINELGIKVIRFKNNEVLKDKEVVIAKILSYIHKRNS